MSLTGGNKLLATLAASTGVKHRIINLCQVGYYLSSTQSTIAALNATSPSSVSYVSSRPITTTTNRQYLPIYTYQKNCRKNYIAFDGQYQTSKQLVRFANTSSGYYAPSTLNSRQSVHNHESGGILTVYEDSDHLPALPVPKLENTLEKLRETISPIAMNPIEYASTLKLMDKFSRTAGRKLDLLLRNKARQTKNWMTHDWWLNEVYLKSREPLMINSNPSMTYPSFPLDVNNRKAVVNTAAQLISAVFDFRLALMHGYNPEATGPDNELRLDPNICYNQYKHIFGSTRVPGEQIDSMKIRTPVEKEPISIVISCKGQFFQVELTDLEDEKVRVDLLTTILDRVIELTSEKTLDQDQMLNSSPGVLTAMRRDDWAKIYPLLDKDSMDAINESQFVVCLDTLDPEKALDRHVSPVVESQIGTEQHSAALGRQILHSDKLNIGNRWFDKTLQLVIVADQDANRLLGAGINYEHSLAEGTVVAKLIEYTYDKAVQNIRNNDKSGNFFARQQVGPQEPASFRQLKMFDDNHKSSFDVVAEGLRRARRDYTSQIDQFDMSYLCYKQYGSNFIKSCRFSPDSWFQVALQMAFHTAHNRLAPCYESASTRRFAYGRSETIRSLTKDVAEFCLDPNYERLHAAIQSHKSYAIDANNASAIDRVLMGFRMTFNELKTKNWSWGIPKSDEFKDLYSGKKSFAGDPENFEPGLEDVFTEDEVRIMSSFFNNELIERSRRFLLSTSQVPSVHPNICMSYGPLVADGYGCCYNITGQQIVASISANSSNQSFVCEVDKLDESLRKSLDTMGDIIETEQQRSKNK